MEKVTFSAKINGEQVSLDISPNLRLVDLLKMLDLTGTKEGCGEEMWCLYCDCKRANCKFLLALAMQAAEDIGR